MEKSHNYGYPVLFFGTLILGLIASVFCVVAEFKKSQEVDVKLDGKLCNVPETKAYGYGTSSLICFSTAQIVGNLIVILFFPKRLTISIVLLTISWLSYVVAVVLVGTGISMSKRQRYGKGWLDGECYLVKDGIFLGSAFFILLSLACTSLSALTNSKGSLLNKRHDSDHKVRHFSN